MDKGKTFELKAYEALSEALRNNRLGLLPSACKIFHRKGYFSIEVSLPGAPTWSLLWAWECKEYKGSIPVDDIEEFLSKLDQIAGANVKGGFVVSGALQESALNVARAKGIMVVRLLPENQIDHILWDMEPGPQPSQAEIVEMQRAMALKALTDPEFRGNRQQFFGLCGTDAVFDWSSVVERVLGEVSVLKEIVGIFYLHIEDVFIPSGKVAVCGRIEIGRIVVGERVRLVSKNVNYEATISKIEILGFPIKSASAGDYVCLIFSDLPQGVISREFIVANDKAIAFFEFGV